MAPVFAFRFVAFVVLHCIALHRDSRRGMRERTCICLAAFVAFASDVVVVVVVVVGGSAALWLPHLRGH